MKMFGKYGRILEGQTRNEIHENNRTREEGFETDANVGEESDISNF
jgi:hypothetical protein